jgi:hypothetical protein
VLKSDEDVLPVQVVSHLGEHKAAGVKLLLSVQVFKNISAEPE